MGKVRSLVIAISFAIIFILIMGCAAMAPVTEVSQNPADTIQATQDPDIKLKKFCSSFTAHLPYAPHVAVPMQPSGGYDLDPSEGGYGFGVAIDYTLMPGLRLVLDGTYSTYKRLVAENGVQSTSEWVFEMMDYLDHFTPAWAQDDVFMNMTSTGFKLGLKYGKDIRNFQPWFGLYYGYYSWQCNFLNKDKSSTWGSDEGYVGGLTYAVGIDFHIKGGTNNQDLFILTVFGEGASPVANPEINDLFYTGWTWNNAGGNHIMAPYRLGIALSF
ncbi:MAG: hypothetical protein JXR67_10100 [Bacteroidales bacterium]|nr:hypothetical protein [Bacteroidales bacterium]